MAYSEQLGLNLQVGGRMRDGPSCQPRAIQISTVRMRIPWVKGEAGASLPGHRR
jgi:hypothetical protein